MLKTKFPERKMKLIAAAIMVLICPLAYAADSEQQEFMNATTASIEKYIAVPCETPQTAEIKVQLESFPNGYLKSINVVQSSGYPQYDRAVLKAVATAQPFPATDPGVVKELGSSIMYFRPGIPSYRCNLEPLNGEIPHLMVNGLLAEPKTDSK
jgi:TonB family protein